MRDWDDLRLFLAAARSHSFTGAAVRVGMDATTVSRRIQRLEDETGATLFVRSPQGLHLTGEGLRLQAAALEVETAVEAAQAESPHGASPAGRVRISTSEGFGAHVLAAAAPGFLARHAGLTLELVTIPGFLSPATREADITVSLAPLNSGRLRVSHLTDYGLSLYASRAYLDARSPPRSLDDLQAHTLVGYVDDLIYATELRYLDEVGSRLRPALSSSSIVAQREMIACGGGVGVLPDFMADGGGLVRVLAEAFHITRSFWIAIHKDLAGVQRVRAVERWLRAVVEEKANLLMGGGARGS
jgi:DNA-binding transcriptional LysR family regulator